MTADAMTGVRDNVIEVGMNDYITKPIDPGQLWDTLVKWIKPGDREMPEGYNLHKDSKSIPEINIPIIDGIDTVGGLKRVGGNSELYVKLLKRFVSDFTDFEKDLVSFMSSDKTDEVVRLVHTLKGVSANLGADRLSDKSALLELAVKEEVDVEITLEEVSSQLSDIFQNIRSSGILESEKKDGLDNKAISRDEISDKLRSAVESLKKRKPKPAQDTLDKLVLNDLPEEMYRKLDDSIKALNGYKMKEAMVILETILNDLKGK